MPLAFVLDFLRHLAANNNTAWMQAHRDDYQRARDAFADLVAEVLRQATPVAPELAGLTPAQAMFRLHKNDRSQTDPEPYKRRQRVVGRQHRAAPREGCALLQMQVGDDEKVLLGRIDDARRVADQETAVQKRLHARALRLFDPPRQAVHARSPRRS